MPSLEAEYDNRALVPEHSEIFARWQRDASAYRSAAAGASELGLRYGPTERQIVDIFYPVHKQGAPLALFIHGGYWRSLDPAMFSHLARPLNMRGVTVALCGYDLCPNVRVTDIIEQVREACRLLWQRFGQRMLVYGHSAGGHLAACMVATNWDALDDRLPADLVPVGVSISGLSDLTPLLQVPVNADLRMDANEAQAASPLNWPVGADRTCDFIVGGSESSEFRRQSRIIADGWSHKGAVTRYEEVAGANHFTVVDPFADDGSAQVARLVTLAARVSGAVRA
jgi:arylformamidase